MNPSRILVADDDPTIRRFIATLLADRGYEIHEAPDGEQAYRMAEMVKPDLMLLDLIMPFRDGFDVLSELKSQDTTRRIPIIIMSVKDREEEIVKGFTLGAEDYVVKPFNSLELVSRVRKILERSRS
ncbi:MAG TPA: response regulator transcription factor [Candidatus Polarisedimenticolia bacterium]|jgi:DNA-binding response OmpR family regulator|nr:response regulator transcription factor [Candidatus Polarisedimenticolia bacterium]